MVESSQQPKICINYHKLNGQNMTEMDRMSNPGSIRVRPSIIELTIRTTTYTF